MAADTTTTGQATSTGLDENLAGALSYVLGFITGAVFFVLEEDNQFVKFHAAQSIVFSLSVAALGIALSIVSAVLGFIPVVGDLLGGIVGLGNTLLSVVFFVGWLFLMYKAYSHEAYELPVLGGIARSLAS
jgi:uncharacterized membrane protein